MTFNAVQTHTFVRLKRAPPAFIISFVSWPANTTSPTAHAVFRRLMPCTFNYDIYIYIYLSTHFDPWFITSLSSICCAHTRSRTASLSSAYASKPTTSLPVNVCSSVLGGSQTTYPGRAWLCTYIILFSSPQDRHDFTYMCITSIIATPSNWANALSSWRNSQTLFCD